MPRLRLAGDAPLMTIGATVIAIRGMLNRSSANKATNPIARAATKAADASIVPRSVKINRRSFAAKAKSPTTRTVRGGQLNSIAKAEAAATT